MIHLDDLKTFVHNDRSTKMDMILPAITTLISGLIIILSISPQYLRELNPFTLLLLSIASALPVWAVNQLLWLHLERRLGSQVIGRIVLLFDISVKEKKVMSFALTRLMKAFGVMRFVPTKDIANLVTIVTIYFGAAFVYFTQQSPARLYITILALSLLIWLVCLCVLQRYCQKIDIKPIKKAWEELITNDELIGHISQQFASIEELVRSRTSAAHSEEGTDQPPGDS